MKLEAEDYLMSNCPNLNVVILRPGFVWHEQERPWSVPIKAMSDIGFRLR